MFKTPPQQAQPIANWRVGIGAVIGGLFGLLVGWHITEGMGVVAFVLAFGIVGALARAVADESGGPRGLSQAR